MNNYLKSIGIQIQIGLIFLILFLVYVALTIDLIFIGFIFPCGLFLYQGIRMYKKEWKIILGVKSRK